MQKSKWHSWILKYRVTGIISDVNGHASCISWPVKVKVTQSCPTLCDPLDHTVHGILQDRILEWVANPFSRVSSQPRDWIHISCIAGRFFLLLLLLLFYCSRFWHPLKWNSHGFTCVPHPAEAWSWWKTESQQGEPHVIHNPILVKTFNESMTKPKNPFHTLRSNHTWCHKSWGWGENISFTKNAKF